VAISLPIALAVITILEQRQTLPPTGATIARPKLDGPRHLRLVAPRDTVLRLNGAPLSPNENGDFDITGRLPATLTVSPPAKVDLVITPRVYIARQEFRFQGRELAALIWVRNTLENTVNAFLTLTAPGLHLESTATVPPGVTQPVEIRGKVPDGVTNWIVTTLLEKEEEAMEGGYKFQVTQSVSSVQP
jgi:hypothetical protein